MKDSAHLDLEFIGKQRLQLEKMRRELVASKGSREKEESDTNAELGGLARTYEDDAQRLTAVELAGLLSITERRRIQEIDRALEKITEGSYGLSDRSRAPIPRERLEAVPEALLTLDEQNTTDAKR